MAYNRWLSAAPPVSEEDLLHYGVVGMKWGVRKAQYYASKANKLGLSPDTAAKKLEYLRKYNETVNALKTKSRGQLVKYDTTYRKHQDLAKKYLLESDRRLNKFFKDYHGAEKYRKRFEKSQNRANRVNAKEERFYKEMIKAYEKLKIQPDSDLVEKGKEIVHRSDVMSMTVYASEMQKKGKKMKHDIGFDVVSSYLGNEVVEGFDLVHHGVKGQRKGIQNGPPYPLYRQDKFSKNGKSVDPETYKRVQAKASGSGGHANPSTYKKTKAEVRSEKKAVRKANPNGTPQDQEEKNSLFARIKRANREKEAQRKQQQAAEAEREAKGREAVKRLMESDLPDEEKNRIMGQLSNAISLSVANGDKRYMNPDYINNAIDSYHQKQADAKAAQEAEREAVKRHGTAEEVMKFRESFTTEEWNDIARRLEAEERVKRFLNKPVEKIPESNNKQQNQNDSSRAVSESEQKVMKGLSSNEKKIFLSGDARTVFENKTKFTPEQLRAVTNRLDAEEKVGQYANRQITLDSAKYLKFKNTVKWINTAGNAAESMYKIAKLIDPTIGNDKNIRGARTNTEEILKKMDGLIKRLDGSSGKQDQGNKQHFKGKKKQNNS